MANIEKRKDSYRFTVSDGYDINGKKIVYRMTWKPEGKYTPKQLEKEVQKQAALFEENVLNGNFSNSSIRFAEFAEQWLNDYAEMNLRLNTLASYKSLLVRINQAIGHIKMKELKPQHLTAFYKNLTEEGVREDIRYHTYVDLRKFIKGKKFTFESLSEASGVSVTTIASAVKGNNIQAKNAEGLSKALNVKLNEIFEAVGDDKGLSGKTILHYHRLISSICSTAVQWQIISFNPCDRVKPPKVSKKEAAYLDEEEALKFIEYLDDEPIIYKAFYTLAINTGMRRGELLGLEWKDIDFENNVIDINKSNMYLSGEGIFEDDTKNLSSSRIIKVPAYALEVMKEWKIEQGLERLKIGDQWQGSKKVFTSWNGTPIHPSTVSNHLKKIIEKHPDLPDIHLHSLRHTNASIMIFNNVPITTASKRLGHSTPNTTGRTYAHVIKKADEIAAEALNDIFAPKARKQA